MVGQRPQQCFMTPLLIGTDGSQKMSKSLGNYIGVAEPPEEIYGKVMSISDSLILQYFELVTDVPDEEVAEFRQELDNQTINPMMLKKRLAREIIVQLYDQKTAAEAEEHFERTVQKKEVPEEIPEFRLSFKNLSPQQMEVTGVDISRLLVLTGQAKSHSEANRLIAQGAVSIDGKKISSNLAPIKSGSIIKVGKRRFAKVIDTDISP
jgi:tyrosyl-tRNA synthetase